MPSLVVPLLTQTMSCGHPPQSLVPPSLTSPPVSPAQSHRCQQQLLAGSLSPSCPHPNPSSLGARGGEAQLHELLSLPSHVGPCGLRSLTFPKHPCPTHSPSPCLSTCILRFSSHQFSGAYSNIRVLSSTCFRMLQHTLSCFTAVFMSSHPLLLSSVHSSSLE